MRHYGLIGKKLSHSYSKEYFSKKIAEEHIPDAAYELYEIADIVQVIPLIQTHKLIGLNVTIPYKQTVMPLLDELDETALKAGAVNTIKITATGRKIGYNTDYYGFKKSLEKYYTGKLRKAIVLGNGGASKAVQAVLKDMGISYQLVSRVAAEGIITYRDLSDEKIQETDLIINTTPLGMYPDVNTSPAINYKAIGAKHQVYDLVYNPALTEFLKKAQEQQAEIKNGLEMLQLQAEEAWKIWQE